MFGERRIENVRERERGFVRVFFYFVCVCGCALTRRGVGQGRVFTMFVDSGGKLSKKKKPKKHLCAFIQVRLFV